MRCVACDSSAISERPERTTQGYRRFRCRTCGKQFNERSAGVLNRTQYPSDVVALVVLWRLRYKLSLRDLAEMFLIRGIVFSYEAVRDWDKADADAGREFAAPATARQDWAQLVRRRDLRQSPRPLVLSLPRHRHVGRAGGRPAERDPRHGGRQSVLPLAKAVTGITPARVTTDGHDSSKSNPDWNLAKLCAIGPTNI